MFYSLNLWIQVVIYLSLFSFIQGEGPHLKQKLFEINVCSQHKNQIEDFEKNSSDKQQLQQRVLNSEGKKIVLPLTSILNIHYDTELYFGQNKQPFKLIIDTGSTALWIPDETCSNCKENNLWKLYSCHKSNTCHSLNSKENSVTIEYSIGEVVGFPANEKLYLSDKEETGFDYSFLLIDQVQHFRYPQIQGIIGLGREYGSEFNSTILTALKSNGIIDQKVFSLFLSDSSCQGNSVLVFGGYNPDYADGEVKYVPASTLSLWSVDIASISLSEIMKSQSENKKEISTIKDDEESQKEQEEQQNNSGKVENKSNEKEKNGIEYKIELKTFTAVIDSGTSKIVFPKSDLNGIIDVLKDKFSIQCELKQRSQNQEVLTAICNESDSTKYPIITITIGQIQDQQIKLELLPDEYIDSCSFNLQKVKCVLKLLFVPGTDFILLGDILLTKYYTVFDMDKERIGFVKSKVIQSTPFYSTPIFGAFLLLLFTMCLLVAFTIVCQISTYCKDRTFRQKLQQKTNRYSPDNSTETDYAHSAPRLEMTTKTESSHTEDASGDLSQEEVSDLDNYSGNNNQNNNHLPQSISTNSTSRN